MTHDQHIKELQEKAREIFVENGAEIEHTRWSKWQSYFFSKCEIKPQGHVGGMDDRYMYFALSNDLYQRWVRQINTPYSELSEEEKESDRREVRSYNAILDTLISDTYRAAYKAGVRAVLDSENAKDLAYLATGYAETLSDMQRVSQFVLKTNRLISHATTLLADEKQT
jgi:hypothetical protein